MKDYNMRSRSPSGHNDERHAGGGVSGVQGRHEMKLVQKKHTKTTMWNDEPSPSQKVDKYVRRKKQVGKGADGPGPGERVA